MYQHRRRPFLSQNFLVNRGLVTKLIRDSSISEADTVLEIGPGRGLITAQLLSVAQQVITVEADPKLYHTLPTHPKLRSYLGNFLTFPLPTHPYKVFANIPFSITGEIIKKLFLTPHTPDDCYLVMQTEATLKFLATDHTNTMLAILFYPWFDITIVHHFNPSDFRPIPSVNTCLVRFTKRSQSYVSNQTNYRDFVTHTYLYNSLAKYLLPSTWLHLFATTKILHPGTFIRWQHQEGKLTKIHQTQINLPKTTTVRINK